MYACALKPSAEDPPGFCPSVSPLLGPLDLTNYFVQAELGGILFEE